MSTEIQAPIPPIPSFGRLLREWRSRRSVSQLDLALEAGVSSRHVSFIETGRAQPSREMILMLARVLANDHCGTEQRTVNRIGSPVIDNDPPASRSR